MSWVLRDKVEPKRGKHYVCCGVVMCINSQKISVAHWIDWIWARFGDEKKGLEFCCDVFGSLLVTFGDSVSALPSENSPSVLRVTPEDGTDTLCRNVANTLPLYATQHPRREKTQLYRGGSLILAKRKKFIPAANRVPDVRTVTSLPVEWVTADFRNKNVVEGVLNKCHVLVQKLMIAQSGRKFRVIDEGPLRFSPEPLYFHTMSSHPNLGLACGLFAPITVQSAPVDFASRCLRSNEIPIIRCDFIAWWQRHLLYRCESYLSHGLGVFVVTT